MIIKIIVKEFCLSDGLLRNVSSKCIVSGSLLYLEFDLTWDQNFLVMSPGSSSLFFITHIFEQLSFILKIYFTLDNILSVSFNPRIIFEFYGLYPCSYMLRSILRQTTET